MINVLFTKKHNDLIAFKIEGHSGYDEIGKDIVCSAVSAVSLTTLMGITEILKIDASYEIKDGFLNFNLFSNKPEEVQKSQVILKTMLLGFERMQESYNKYLNVKIEEV